MECSFSGTYLIYLRIKICRKHQLDVVFNLLTVGIALANSNDTAANLPIFFHGEVIAKENVEIGSEITVDYGKYMDKAQLTSCNFHSIFFSKGSKP